MDGQKNYNNIKIITRSQQYNISMVEKTGHGSVHDLGYIPDLIYYLIILKYVFKINSKDNKKILILIKI